MRAAAISRYVTYALGALAVGAPFAVYVYTLAPGITFEDAGELAAAAATLGVAHPSGYPLFTLWGHLFTLSPAGNPAWRVNLSSAAAASLCCGCVFLIVRRLARGKREFAASVAALTAAWLLAFGRTFWSQAVVTEVYSLAALAVAVSIYGALRFSEEGDARFFYGVALAAGLALAAHPVTVLVTAPALIYALASRRGLAPRSVYLGAAFAAFGAAAYLYIPLRASAAPALNWGDAETAPAFIAHVTRRMYGGADFARLPFLADQLLEWAGLTWREFGPGVAVTAAVGLALAILGKHAGRFFFLALAALTGPVAAASLTLLLQSHQLVGIAVWFIPFFLIAAIMAGYAFLRGLTLPPPALRVASGCVAVAAVAAAVASNAGWNDYRSYVYASDFGADFLRTISYRGANIMFEGASLGVFEVAYLKKVENRRPDHAFWDATGRVFPPSPRGCPWNDAMEPDWLASSPAAFYSVLRAQPIRYGYVLEPAGILYRAYLLPPPRTAISVVWGRYGWKEAVSGETPRGEKWTEDQPARAAWCKYRLMLASERFIAGERPAAWETLAEGRAVARGLPDELAEIATAYLMFGRARDAAETFGEAAAVVPRGGRGDAPTRWHYAQLMNNKAAAHLYAGDVDGAAAALAASLAAYPDQPEMRRLSEPANLAWAARNVERAGP